MRSPRDPKAPKLGTLFVLGPSGVGKSAFGSFLRDHHTWLHLEIDCFPEATGINLHGLDEAWKEYQFQHDPGPLVAALDQRRQETGANGVVLTFPSGTLLPHLFIEAGWSAGIHVIYLYATAGDCIASFISREKATGRNLGTRHWLQNNSQTYLGMSAPELAPYRVVAFHPDGSRRTWQEIHGEIAAAADKRSQPVARNA